ncbi:MAG: A/G-specific adenine glycosylase [Bacteroidetes bacterium]|nr:A/G-specific adenine glycosylase [Bacteroidota bacterium]
MKNDFSKKLLQWNSEENKRSMPWKGEKDPYKIWLSEIILQQTRVEQGWAYYENFIKTFPTVHDLAKAPEKEVFKMWEGLGYYNRCRNLIQTAKKISTEYNGKFPSSYDEIKNLKGIGPYTAAAISSFAFNLPYAVVDGNVERILSRYFGINTPVDTAEGKKKFTTLADSLLDKATPGKYNQAIMDFGAVICKPKNPLCDQCVQSKKCYAFLQHKIEELPVKKKTIAKKIRWLYYFIVEVDDEIYIRKRTEKDIWQNLYEFVLLETQRSITEKEILKSSVAKTFFANEKYAVKHISPVYKQQLSHQTINGSFIHVRLKKPVKDSGAYFLVNKKEIKKYAFPKFITHHLKSENG